MFLLRNAEIYAPEPLGVAEVLVCGESIVWIGNDLATMPAALTVEEIDLAGRRLIPGLIDCHVHLTGGGGETGGARFRVPRRTLSELTAGGVTTAVGLLGTDDTTRTTGDLVATARGLTEEGITAYCYTGGYHLPPTTLTGSIRGDITWIDVVIGVGELALSDHRSSQPTLDELLRVAADAHVAGLMTGKAGLVHLHMGDGARGLALVREALDAAEIPARVFNPTHVNRKRELFDEAMDLAQRGCTIDVTAFPPSDDEDEYGAAAALLAYLDAGLPPAHITVSSDGGGCLPRFDEQGNPLGMEVAGTDAMARCLSELLAAGATLERVLPAFTVNVAASLRLRAKGRIAAGADADLVVLDAEGRVRDVMARGRWQVRDAHPVTWGTFEQDAESGGDGG
ncbi:MAG: beta-aspartyl-peptidase [Acidobacteriota bacterium]